MPSLLFHNVAKAERMAKHTGKGRKYRRYLRGVVNDKIDLGTLGSKVLIGVDLAGTVDEETFVSSLVAVWGISEFTNAIGDGPIVVGVAHGDYSDAEIEAFIENAASWKSGDLTAQEIAKRKIGIVGEFRTSPSDSSGVQVLNEGKPIHTKCNWILKTGETLHIWAYNQGESPLATTDPDVDVTGHVNLWPR